MNYETLTRRKSKGAKRKNLKLLCNGVKSAFSFGELKTWLDVYKRLGYDPRYIEVTFPPGLRAKVVLFPELKDYLDKLQLDLELRLNPPSVAREEYRKEPSNEQNTKLLPNASRAETVCAVSQGDGQVLHEADKDIKTSSEEGIYNQKDYGLIPSPNEKAFHYWFQKKAIREIFDLVKEGKSCLLIAGTGKGKTFITYAVLRRLLDMGFEDGRTLSHTPYLVLTRTTIKEQHRRVAKNFYNIDVDQCEINNIEVVRSKAGRFWIREKRLIIDGEEVIQYEWKRDLQPCVVFFDESQAAKNNDKSKQAQIMCAYNDLPKNNILVSISATPFTRVSEAKCFAVSTHCNLEPLGFPKGTVLTNKNWQSFARAICGDKCDPEDYNEAAVQRLMSYLDKWVVRVKGVRSQFNEKNNIERMQFQSKEARLFYDKALTRMQEQKAKLERDKALGVTSDLHPFAIMTAFARAAELCRAEPIADRMFKAKEEGFAACAAIKYKSTLIAIEQFLENKHGVSRDQISLVWGGGQTELTAKQKTKAKLREMKDKLEAAGVDLNDMIEDMDLSEVEDAELLKLPKSSRLGPQSLQERQIEIDNFQSGKTLFCLYTFKAGGVGLSLHHTDELVKYKVKRKESGYAIEEDIPNCPTRPRKNIVAPTYSAIELVQGLGRCPRLTSLSDTEQTLLFYAGTIEDEIADIVSEKLRCLSYVVRMKESWQDMILGGVSKDAYLETTAKVKSDEPGVGAGEIDVDEEGEDE